ncbi:unnamed protein product [Peronospora belbahrii]|uniref:Uncharacterized protein n=1 Tax=Peronospora belbahrii TaxID=622444 RepID=A0AAU9KSX1_9STRA|nr:unnamed protein product [Peronospora belbahrii]
MDKVWTLETSGFPRSLQTLSTSDTLREHENEVLRDQIHDLTELLAAFDLCELQDSHLITVRDRAFQRDITPDIEVYRPYDMDYHRPLEQQDIQQALNEDSSEQTRSRSCYKEPSESSECFENSSSIVLDMDSLQQRMELLEREVIILRLRQELSEETTSKLQWSAVNIEASHASHDPNVDPDQAQRDRIVCEQEKQREGIKTAMQEQQERIAELEDTLATEVRKNAALQQQILRYSQVENILLEFSRCHSSTS